MPATIRNHTLRILLVEDSDVHAAMLREALTSLPRQLHVTVARNLAEGRAYLAESTPDLALIDIHLPDGKGLALLPGSPDTSAYPAIVVTGQGDEQIAVEALKAGALDYVVKSSAALTNLPHVIERVLREWHHIAERRRAEEALRRERDFNRTLIQSSAAFFVAIGADGKTIMMNETMLGALGYAAEEVTGTDYLAAFVPEDDRPMLAGIFATLTQQKKPTVNVNRVLTRDGRELTVEWHGRPVFTATGEFDYFFGVGVDVTARQKAEEALQAAHRQLQDIIEFLPDATFVIDQDKKVIAWNRAMEELSGTPKERMIGRGNGAYAEAFYGHRRPLLIDLLDEPDPAVEATYDVVERDDLSLYAEGFVPSLRAGRGAYLWGKASTLLDQEGNRVGAIESLHDITARKEARDKLEAANRELEAFAYTVSHDLRTPLTPIIGYAEFLRESCRERLTAQELRYLSEISESGNRMATLMEELLDLAKAGRVERPDVPIDAGEVVNKVVSDLAGRIQQVGSSVVVGPLPVLRVPKTLLSQLFDNLIGNALRYGCKAGDVIEVGGERQGERGRLFVRDHGPGIPIEERSRIFEVFYRGTSGKAEKGTGVGLATVLKIAKSFGGHAWVEETAGGGSTFWVEMVDGG